MEPTPNFSLTSETRYDFSNERPFVPHRRYALGVYVPGAGESVLEHALYLGGADGRHVFGRISSLEHVSLYELGRDRDGRLSTNDARPVDASRMHPEERRYAHRILSALSTKDSGEEQQYAR